MRIFAFIVFLFALYVPNIALAQGVVPFASDLNMDIKHYNRLNATLATSGVFDAKDIKELADNNIKTIINLRGFAEIGDIDLEKKAAAKYGITYIHIPVNGQVGITQENLRIFTKAYTKHKAQPMLIHCGSGNRVGALWLAYLLHKGVDIDTALHAGEASGLRDGLKRKVLAQHYQKYSADKNIEPVKP